MGDEIDKIDKAWEVTDEAVSEAYRTAPGTVRQIMDVAVAHVRPRVEAAYATPLKTIQSPPPRTEWIRIGDTIHNPETGASYERTDYGRNCRVNYSRGRSVVSWLGPAADALWSYLTDPDKFPHVDLTPAAVTPAKNLVAAATEWVAKLELAKANATTTDRSPMGTVKVDGVPCPAKLSMASMSDPSES